MLKKILVIIASPRHGNSLKVTKQFEENLKKLGDYNFEYVFLSEVDLRFCQGCHNCLFLGEDKCPIKDDKSKIYQKMQAADGIVLVSPVYVVNVSGLMKNFIDRMCFICHRPEFFKQNVLIISTVAALGLPRVLKYLKEVAEVWGAKSITSLGLMTPPEEKNLNSKNIKKIKQAAEAYHLQFSRPFKPSLNQVIQFEIQRAVFITESGKAVSPADYAHYIKLKNQSFNIPIKVSPIKSFFAKIFKKIAMIFIS